MSEPTPRSRRNSVYELFAHEEASAAGQAVRVTLVLLIALSVITAILESVPAIGRAHGSLLDAIQLFTTAGFALEYALRIWVAPEQPGSTTPGRARWRYIFSLPGIVDLIAAIRFSLATRIGLQLDWH